MLFKHHIQQIITATVATSCIALGIYTLGQPRLFDASAILLLLITAFFCRQHIDITSLIALLIIGRLAEELIYYTSSLNPLFTISAYILCAYCLYQFTRDKMRYLAALAFLIAITAQTYWYLTNYPAPELYWQIYIISFSIITRFLLVFRPAITQHLTNKTASHTQLDYKLQQVYGMPIAVEFLNIIEYTLRHTTQFKPLFIYTIYPYVMQIIATYALWLVIHHGKQYWAKNTLIA